MARDLQTKDKTLDPNLYVYRQARDVSKTQVDWANLTNELTKDLATIRETREKTRQDARDRNRELINELNTLDPYAHETANTKIQAAAYDASQLLMTDFNLVVNGEKKLKDYKQTEQLLSDNFNSLKGAMDTYVEHFEIAKERAENDQANIGELYNNESLAGFGSLSALNIVVQPSGAINLVKKQFDANGNEIEVDLTNPENLMSITHVNDRVQYQADYVDPNETAQKTVNTLGAFITAEFMSRQSVASLEDFRLMKYIDDNGDEKKGSDVISAMADELAVTDNQKLSLLQLSGFTSDDITQDPEVAEREGKILQIPNVNGSGMMGYEFSEEHEKIIRDQSLMIVERQLDSKMAKEKGLGYVSRGRETSAGYQQQNTENVANSIMSYVNQLVTGDASVAQANAGSLTDLVNQYPGGSGDKAVRVENISRTENADGSITISIKREGMGAQTINSSGLTPEEFDVAVYDALNTTSIVGRTAMDNFGGNNVGSEFGMGDASYTAPERTVGDINVPDFNADLREGLVLDDFVMKDLGVAESSDMFSLSNPPGNRSGFTASMKNNMRRIINTEPGLADALDGDYDVYYDTDSDGNEKLYFEVGGKRRSYDVTSSNRTTAGRIVGTIKAVITDAAEDKSQGSAPGDDAWDD